MTHFGLLLLSHICFDTHIPPGINKVHLISSIYAAYRMLKIIPKQLIKSSKLFSQNSPPFLMDCSAILPRRARREGAHRINPSDSLRDDTPGCGGDRHRKKTEAEQ
jgi:hypothetical protein